MYYMLLAPRLHRRKRDRSNQWKGHRSLKKQQSSSTILEWLEPAIEKIIYHYNNNDTSKVKISRNFTENHYIFFRYINDLKILRIKTYPVLVVIFEYMLVPINLILYMQCIADLLERSWHLKMSRETLLTTNLFW